MSRTQYRHVSAVAARVRRIVGRYRRQERRLLEMLYLLPAESSSLCVAALVWHIDSPAMGVTKERDHVF